MKKLGFLLFLIFLPLLSISGCSKKSTSEPSSTNEGKKIEYYTCSMHPFIHQDKPGHCPICGMPLVPVYSEAEVPGKAMESQPSTAPAPSGPQAGKEKTIRYWVDPMHPWYKSDKPGKAPDCGMDLVPVYEEAAGPESAPSQLSEMSTVRLSNEKQQLIGVRTETVERRMLKREIRAAGRVALNPDLVLAQNEYLIALRTSGGDLSGYQNSLIRASQMRLRALGMSDAQIKDLRHQRKPQMSLLVPQNGDTVWIFGSVFESDFPWVKVGTPVQVQLPGSSQTYSSQVESIDPMIDSMTRTGTVRLRLSNLQGELKGDMFVRLTLNAEGSEALALPENAILDSGKRQIVFVDKGDGRFEPREVKLGKRGTGYVEVLSGVAPGEKVVTNANFLLDSESRLKAALEGMKH